MGYAIKLGLPTQPIFTKFGGKVAHRPRKKILYFGSNPDHITLGLGLGNWGLRLQSWIPR